MQNCIPFWCSNLTTGNLLLYKSTKKMIDYIKLITLNRQIISMLQDKIKTHFIPMPDEKGYVNTKIYSNGKGVKFYFQLNKHGECPKVLIAFSPHLIKNNNLHNADYLSFDEAKKTIQKTLKNIGIVEIDYKEFYFSKIELGINFTSIRNAKEILKSALMSGNMFFTLHDKFKHYKYAENHKNKYLKIKFYNKSQQVDEKSGLTYSELKFCPVNTLRFEVVLERARKFKFFDFRNLENLFKENAEMLLTEYLKTQFEKLFFFSISEIDRNKLKNKTENKHFYQCQVKNYWRNLETRKRNNVKEIFSNLPKKYDIKNELYAIIFKKMYVEIPYKNNGKNMSKFRTKYLRIYSTKNIDYKKVSNVFCYPTRYIDMGITTCFLLNKR